MHKQNQCKPYKLFEIFYAMDRTSHGVSFMCSLVDMAMANTQTTQVISSSNQWLQFSHNSTFTAHNRHRHWLASTAFSTALSRGKSRTRPCDIVNNHNNKTRNKTKQNKKRKSVACCFVFTFDRWRQEKREWPVWPDCECRCTTRWCDVIRSMWRRV